MNTLQHWQNKNFLSHISDLFTDKYEFISHKCVCFAQNCKFNVHILRNLSESLFCEIYVTVLATIKKFYLYISNARQCKQNEH